MTTLSNLEELTLWFDTPFDKLRIPSGIEGLTTIPEQCRGAELAEGLSLLMGNPG